MAINSTKNVSRIRLAEQNIATQRKPQGDKGYGHPRPHVVIVVSDALSC